MAWHINPDVNEGYPYEDSFPETFNTDWDTVTVPLPGTTWRQVDGVNEDYPFTGLFPERFNTNWKYDSLIPMPYMVWRIDPSANEGYPTLGWPSWGDNAGGGTSEGGGMVIGGSRSNYPNGFRSCDRGGIRSQFNNNTMKGHGAASERVLNAINSILSERQFALTASDVITILNYMNNPSNTGSLASDIAELYGANLYDAFLVCKAYPFKIPTGASQDLKLFGRALFSPGQFTTASVCMWEHDFGTCDLDVTQAYEIESTDYSIYLPFCGLYPLDIRDGSALSVMIRVDLFHGLGEYLIFQNNQITGVYKCQLGVDVPLNMSQGIMNSNLSSNILSTVSSGLPLLGSAIGGIAGGPVGATVGGTLGGMVSGVANNTTVHHQVTAPSVGGLGALYSYPTPRVIAKIPKMWGSARGFAEIQGENRSMSFESLNTCSGFVQTKNYKCDIIVATDEEKQEIERLMNGGVFL